VFSPVEPVRAYQRIVEQIESALLSGELSPGETLPSERELMRQFGVSRATVREALRVLESRGLVRSRPGSPNGAEVLSFQTKMLRTPLSQLARVEHVSLTDLLQFRMILEGSATYLAALLRTDEQLAEMEQALQAMASSAEVGLAEFSAADLHFHETVARASGNELLSVCSDVVRDVVLQMMHAHIADAANRTELMQAWLRAHTKLLAAIRDGDADLAAERIRQDLFEHYQMQVAPERRQVLEQMLSTGS
jgi:GntR family transcriptional repressor for pyruvate dehydrogenase complex